jgi:glycosyltransferase involved in cell wall biosynthesis
MVFDIDDAIWEPPAHVTSPFLRFVDFGWVRKMSKLCAHAIVGNQHLANYVRAYNPHITIIPTCIDMDRHQVLDNVVTDKEVVLGWTGLKDNLGYMDIIGDVLQNIARKHPIKILVASGADYHLDGVKVENHTWVLENEINYLCESDIGLMPLKDTPRARGKCAFKALQYMAVGVPTVISPVGMNADAIEDGISGFLANTPEEWRIRLECLITNPQLRHVMGRAARERVIALYSHKANYPKFKGVMETVAGRSEEGESL